MKFVVAVDVGATNLRVALCRSDGVFLGKLTTRTPREGDAYAVVDTVVAMIKRVLRDCSVESIHAIGVGTIGPLDIRFGRVVNPPNLPYRVIELGRPLHEVFKVPVYVVNDCVAGVWGEKFFGYGIKHFTFFNFNSFIRQRK